MHFQKISYFQWAEWIGGGVDASQSEGVAKWDTSKFLIKKHKKTDKMKTMVFNKMIIALRHKYWGNLLREKSDNHTTSVGLDEDRCLKNI